MLLETKSVKSNLHKPNIKKVPPTSGIFYVPSVVQGTGNHSPTTKQTGPILFASVRAKRMGDRLAHPIRFCLHRHNYKNRYPLLLRGQPSEYSSVRKIGTLDVSDYHLLGLVVYFRSGGCVPMPKQPHHTKEPLSSLPEHLPSYLSTHLLKCVVSLSLGLLGSSRYTNILPPTN